MQIIWRLRMAAAQREVWTGTQLRRLLAERAGLELSSASVSALFTRQPSQVKLTTLAALCTALQCSPADLFDIDTTARGASGGGCRASPARCRWRAAGRPGTLHAADLSTASHDDSKDQRLRPLRPPGRHRRT